MSTVVAHGEEAATTVRSVGDYIGNPMYGVIPEHRAALVAIVIAAAGLWFLRRSARTGGRRSSKYVAEYQALAPMHRLLFWLISAAGIVHVGLVFGHEPGAYSAAFLVGALAELWVVRRLLSGGPWRGRRAIVLSASLLAYFVSNASGEPPDQVGLATKLIEITALWIVVSAPADRRLRRLVGSGAMILVFVLLGVGAWVGAFTGVEESHHVGEASQPGTLVPLGEDQDPTEHEMREADELYEATVAAIARYEDPRVAATDGYNIDGMYGREFHATNESYKGDGRVFDPDRPENLIYAVSDDGPVLIGVMFEMEGIGRAGSAVGGPLTVWHAHDHVCFSLTPPSIAGLTSPFGVCPMGSVTIPMTNEMIHLWTLPGAPDRFGHLEEEWLDTYLEAAAG